MCFKYAILSCLHYGDIARDHQRVRKYDEYSDELKFDDIQFPVRLKDIPKFEVLNEISVNVYMLNKKKDRNFTVSPCHLTKAKKNCHVNLLLLEEKYYCEGEVVNEELSNNFHYTWIKDLSALLSQKKTKGKKNQKQNHRFVCDICMHWFWKEQLLNEHVLACSLINKCKVTLPVKDKNNILKFKDFKNQERVLFTIYADLECILKSVDDEDDRIYQEHIPFSIGYYFHCSFDDSLNEYQCYRQRSEEEMTPSLWFAQELLDRARQLENLYKNPRPMIPLSHDQQVAYDQAKVCHACNKPFNDPNNKKVRDHCHLSGLFRNALHASCNIKYQDSRAIPVLFHNMSGYDAHFLIRDISNVFKGDISLLPINKEKYISFTKRITGSDIYFKFLDSYRFMAAGLDKLASYTEKLDIVEKVFTQDGYSPAQIQLLKRKGIFCYDHVVSLETLEEEQLPSKEKFFSKLNMSDISEADYAHAQDVWAQFNVKTLADYSMLYLQTDVCLLASIFENFRDTCLETYGLDPLHYVSLPSLTWSAALKYTGIELELLTDPTMLLFIEGGIRGGVSFCPKRYAKSNNSYMSNFQPQDEISYLMYYDVTNLYGWALSQAMPVKNFQWVKDLRDKDFFMVDDDAPTGYILEISIDYPDYLHSSHKCLPLLPEHRAPPGSKEKKLLTTLYPKERYVIHYRALKQALEYGLVLKEIHRAISFDQRPWLKPYIDLNSEKRRNAKNTFEKQMFKLCNNAVFGKTLENLRLRRDVKLISHWDGVHGAEALIARPNFHSCTIFDEDLVAIEMGKTEIFMDKPIYVGLSVLDISKTLVYRFHYDYMRAKLGDQCKLLYSDTDSLAYEIKNVNIYEMMKKDLHEFDTSDWPQPNQFGIPGVNKKVVGLMTDECGGRLMTEFVGLRSKMYSLRVEGEDTFKKAKGVKSSVVQSTITFDDYVNCLTENSVLSRDQNSIRSKLHRVCTVKQNKVALSPHDTKRYLLTDGSFETLPWGHYSIRDVEEALAAAAAAAPPSTSPEAAPSGELILDDDWFAESMGGASPPPPPPLPTSMELDDDWFIEPMEREVAAAVTTPTPAEIELEADWFIEPMEREPELVVVGMAAHDDVQHSNPVIRQPASQSQHLEEPERKKLKI